jgi:hypothetical protein
MTSLIRGPEAWEGRRDRQARFSGVAFATRLFVSHCIAGFILPPNLLPSCTGLALTVIEISEPRIWDLFYHVIQFHDSDGRLTEG